MTYSSCHFTQTNIFGYFLYYTLERGFILNILLLIDKVCITAVVIGRRVKPGARFVRCVPRYHKKLR